MIYLNGKPINITLFPDNTSQVWKLPDVDLAEKSFAYVVWRFDHEGEFMHLAQLKRLLSEQRIKTCLELTYLPYARQDKQVSNETTFALRPFADLLNQLNFDQVSCTDPHSWVAEKIINNFVSMYPREELTRVIMETVSTLVCYPDQGALQKYFQLYPEIIFIYGNKIREQDTGKIISYELIGDPSYENVLIVDDICDGGATFTILARELYKAGAREVNLFVSHGIFSNGLKTIKDSGIKHIFTPEGEVSENETGFTYRRV